VLAVLGVRFQTCCRVGLACQPIRECFQRGDRVHRVSRFVLGHQDVQVPLGVGALLYQDARELQHLLYGEELVCRRVQVVELGVQGRRFWLVRPRVVVSQDGAEPQHGTRFAAFGPGQHLVGLGLRKDAVSVGMVPASALMWRWRSWWLLSCWALGLAPWA
jgi:hypothetical protein